MRKEKIIGPRLSLPCEIKLSYTGQSGPPSSSLNLINAVITLMFAIPARLSLYEKI